MPSVADILIEQGRLLADQRRRSGERRGSVVAGLGQIPGQILADRAAMQRAQQQAAIQAEELRMRQNADRRADLTSELAVSADTRAQGTYDDARMSEQRGREAVLGWMKQHAAELKPEETARMQAILAMPGGTKHLVDHLMKAPEGYTLSPGQKRFGADGKEIASVAPTPEKTPVLTFNQPQPLRIGGRVVMTRAGSDGKIYDMRGQAIEGAETAQPYVPPSTAQGPQPSWQWVNRNGEEVYTNRVQPGDKPQTNRVKATEDERKTAGFYGQMSDAIAILDELEPAITEKELYQIQTLPQEKLVGMMNRNQLSEAAKRYLRAFEQFTESRLRPVSGAAIADTEYERDRRTYAKQYGETPKLSEDRMRARNGALAALKKRAGVALDDGNETPKTDGEGWIDLGGGIRVREKK